MGAIPHGYSLCGGNAIDADDKDARERLLRYCLRAPLSLERLSIAPDGNVIYQVKATRHGVETQRVMTTPDLVGELRNEVRHHIGPFATPDVVLVAPGLPKTRSGKIMRRILRKIAADETENLGDVTTLADPDVVQQLLTKRRELSAQFARRFRQKSRGWRSEWNFFVRSLSKGS